MRSIPETLKAKMRLLAQTKANNADPRLDVIISRHVIPLQDYRMWQTSKVANFTGRVSIAIPRPDYRRMPDKIFAGGIDSGVAKIYSADFDGINAPELWTEILTLPDAVDLSLAYLGKFTPFKKGTEFYTTDKYPWVFWIDSNKDLYAQYWDDVSTKIILGANATSCSATMGINSVQGEWGYGLIVAWTTVAGTVFYSQLDAGVWGDAITVTQAPAGAVEVVISRVADVRMVFLVKDSTGAVTAVFFRSIAISLSNYEQLEVSHVKVTAGTTPITFHNISPAAERVEISEVIPTGTILSILAPEVISVTNIDDGAGNFGRFVLVGFKEPVYGFESGFTLTDSLNTSYILFGVIRHENSLNTLLLEFQDFNNAIGNCTITYTPGTLAGAITLSGPFTKSFTPTGLIPVAVDPPIVVSIVNIGEVDPNA